MKFVIAPDSFKESMTALVAAQAIQTGLLRALPTAQCQLIPLADGGEGTVATLVHAHQGEMVLTLTAGPLPGQTIQGAYGLIDNGKTAVIEVAAADGLTLVPRQQRDPLLASSYGTGQQILAALARGVQRIIIGLGGSVSVDGGLGILQALGARCLDDQGQPVPAGGQGLSQVATIDLSTIDPRLSQAELILASDVTNPLLGPHGAAKVFGPQKGVTPKMVVTLEAGMKNFARRMNVTVGRDFSQVAGSGAAGGIGFALLVLGGQLQSGIKLMMAATNLSQAIQTADMVITGEGRIDGQTSFGKVPAGVARLAKQAHKPLIAIGGSLGDDLSALYDMGFTAIFSCLSSVEALDQVLAQGPANLSQTAENIGRLLVLKSK